MLEVASNRGEEKSKRRVKMGKSQTLQVEDTSLGGLFTVT